MLHLFVVAVQLCNAEDFNQSGSSVWSNYSGAAQNNSNESSSSPSSPDSSPLEQLAAAALDELSQIAATNDDGTNWPNNKRASFCDCPPDTQLPKHLHHPNVR